MLASVIAALSDFTSPKVDYHALAPEIVLAAGICLVLLVDLFPERAEETREAIAGEGGTAIVFAGDCTKAAECEAMVARMADSVSRQLSTVLAVAKVAITATAVSTTFREREGNSARAAPPSRQGPNIAR